MSGEYLMFGLLILALIPAVKCLIICVSIEE
jgi:hypothetical protein